MKRYLFLVFIILFYSYRSHCQELKNKEVSKFIIIANVGISNYYIAPIVISTDTIKSIPHPSGDFELYMKYNRFNNLVISDLDYEKILNYLNVYQNCEVRSKGFIKNEKNTLIIDYRKNSSSQDCKLLSIYNLSTVLYTLNSLACYLEEESIGEQLVKLIKAYYQFYLDTYDLHKEYYKQEIKCK